MTLGDILKGTLKVAGSAGLLIAGGLAKSAANIAEENGGDSGAFEKLSDKCFKQIDKMWAGDDYEEPTEDDEYKRKHEILDNRIRRIEKLIRNTESLARDAERAGDTELYEEYKEKIEEYRNTIREIEDDKHQMVNDQYANSDDLSSCDDD